MRRDPDIDHRPNLHPKSHIGDPRHGHCTSTCEVQTRTEKPAHVVFGSSLTESTT